MPASNKDASKNSVSKCRVESDCWKARPWMAVSCEAGVECIQKRVAPAKIQDWGYRVPFSILHVPELQPACAPIMQGVDIGCGKS